MLELIDIHKTYQGKKVETPVLKGIDLKINQGDFVSIIGKSGCGKTTLLNILGLMDNSTKGVYSFDGIDMSSVSKRKMPKYRNEYIGYIFQAYNLIEEMNIIENVGVPLGYKGTSAKVRNEKALELLRQVGLGERIYYYPKQLSGGEQQRVAIARALVNNPKVILADEPTGNLDEKSGKEIMNILDELNSKGTTIVMVTHDKDIASYGNRIIQVVNGKIA